MRYTPASDHNGRNRRPYTGRPGRGHPAGVRPETPRLHCCRAGEAAYRPRTGAEGTRESHQAHCCEECRGNRAATRLTVLPTPGGAARSGRSCDDARSEIASDPPSDGAPVTCGYAPAISRVSHAIRGPVRPVSGRAAWPGLIWHWRCWPRGGRRGRVGGDGRGCVGPVGGQHVVAGDGGRGRGGSGRGA
jgi:hypothetical protein